MASKGKTQARKTSGGGANRFAITLFACLLPLAGMFMPTALVLTVGIVPTLVAWFIDKDADKTAGLTVGAMNLVGCMVFVLQLWVGPQGHTFNHALRILSNPFSWIAMYGAAAVGWAIYFTVPSVVGMLSVGRAQSRIARLEKRQRDLIDEWGEEVTGKELVQPATA